MMPNVAEKRDGGKLQSYGFTPERLRNQIGITETPGDYLKRIGDFTQQGKGGKSPGRISYFFFTERMLTPMAHWLDTETEAALLAYIRPPRP
jgi:hypothetical protein